MVALGAQLITGIELTRRYFPGFEGLFDLNNPFAVAALTKLGRHNLNALAWHILPVTLLSMALVYVGLRFRFGGLTLS